MVYSARSKENVRKKLMNIKETFLEKIEYKSCGSFEFTCLNPFRSNDKKNGSFFFDSDGRCHETANGEGSGLDIIDAYCYKKFGNHEGDAMAIVMGEFGELPDGDGDFMTDPSFFLVGKDEKKSPNIGTEQNWGDDCYVFRTVDGFPIAVVKRDKNKGFKSYSFDGDKWVDNLSGLHGNKPIFGLEKTKNEGRILVVEGEKKAVIAQRFLGSAFIVLSWIGGSSGASKPDWSVIRNRDVTIWPDNDEPGYKAAKSVSEVLPSAKVIQREDIEKFSSKTSMKKEGKPIGATWDIADAISDGLTRDDILSLINSATIKQPDVHVAGVALGSDTPSFVGCFPKQLEEYIQAKAAQLGVSEEGVCGAALGFIAAAIPYGARLKIYDGWMESATLWIALVGDSTTKKSPVLYSMMDFFQDKQKEFNDENSKELKLHEKRKKINTINTKAIEKSSIGALNVADIPDPVDDPVLKYAYVQDVTIESLIHICSMNGRGVLYFQDELTSWASTMLKDDRSQERARYLEGFNSKATSQNRIGRGHISADVFRVSIIGGMQRFPVEKMVKDAFVDGLLPRFIMVTNEISGYPEYKIDDKHKKFYYELLKKLFKLQDGEVKMSEEALNLFVEISKKYQDEIQSFRDSHWKAFLGKRGSFLPRVALILHCIDHMDDDAFYSHDLDVTTLERAAKFIELFVVRAARRIYAEAGAELSINEGIYFDPEEKKIVSFLHSKLMKGEQTITSKALQQGCRAYQSVKKKKTDKMFIENLCLSGLVTLTSTERGMAVFTFNDALKGWKS